MSALEDRLAEALREFALYADADICRHESTSRGGVLWEICNDCGMRWADDRGGKPEFELPSPIVEAQEALAAYEASKSAPAVREVPAEFVEWLAREIPPGTIISAPNWWAPRIWRAAFRYRLNGEKG